MTRKSTLTFEEIQAAEEASDNRRRSRNQGFQKMHERDKATHLLSNDATMLWHVPRELGKEDSHYIDDDNKIVDITIYPPDIPDDSFGLDLKCSNCKKRNRYIFNLDEFRKWIRWG